MTYTFLTEEATKVLSYEEYLHDLLLREKVNNPNRQRLFLGDTILSYDFEWLEHHPDKKELFEKMRMMQLENPLMFFLPTGQGLSFLNDNESDIRYLRAPNRTGKTAHCHIDAILDAIPTSPDWPIFKKYGVKWRKWNGPIKCGFASNMWSTMQRIIWPELKKWIPKYELGDYDTSKPGGKDISWKTSQSCILECGSELYMLCYEQDQSAYESIVMKRMNWDEQPHEYQFDGIDERLRTTHGRQVFGFTPHKMEGRPDTGARTWIQEMENGVKAKGHHVKIYTIPISDVPDWIYPEESKKQAYTKWVVEPKASNDLKTQKEGMARYYGQYHDAGGLVYDEWDDGYHLIDSFEIPPSWTRYRAIDHGNVNPTACLWAAVSPIGDIYLYREYYKADVVFEHAKNIILASGNEVVEAGKLQQKGITCTRMIEKIVHEKYRMTVLDSRSLNTQDTFMGMDVGRLYGIGGLRVTPASGVSTHLAIPIVKQYMRINPDKLHPVNKTKGSPSIFVFRNLTHFRAERAEYANQEFKSFKMLDKKNPSEKPKDKHDHLMDCLVYLVQIPPKYISGVWSFKNGREVGKVFKPTEEWLEDHPKKKTHRDSITGY